MELALECFAYHGLEFCAATPTTLQRLAIPLRYPLQRGYCCRFCPGFAAHWVFGYWLPTRVHRTLLVVNQ